MRARFCEKFSLGELNNKEWEALCDGCGQCCLKRRVENREVKVYSVACELLDIEAVRCRDYSNRLQRVPTCHKLTPATVPRYQEWLPDSCAYVRLHRNQPLADWHPLLAGDRSRMVAEGVTISHYAIPSGTLSRRQKERHVISRWPTVKKRSKIVQKSSRGASLPPEGRAAYRRNT